MLVDRNDTSGIDELGGVNWSHGSRGESHASVLLDATNCSGGLGGVLDLLTGNAVSDLGGLWVWLVDLAVGPVLEGFDGLQVENQTTFCALQASLVP